MGGHGADLVKTLDEHALAVKVGESERAFHILHVMTAPPVGDRLQEGLADTVVVDEVNPPEAYSLPVPCLVGPVVDDSDHSSDNFSVPLGQEELEVAELKRGILLWVECIFQAAVKFRDSIGISLIQVVIEVYETVHVTRRADLDNVYF